MSGYRRDDVFPPETTDQDLVDVWLRHLRRQVAELEATIHSGAAEPWVEAQLVRFRAWRELLARGLDPTKPRLFRGPVQLEVRCRNRGHIVARVYPTGDWSIFVPTISKLLEPDLSEQDWSDFGYSEAERKRDGGWVWRDRWIQGWYEVDDDPDHLTIPGSRVLTDRPVREGPRPTDDAQGNLWDVFCRCGRTHISRDDLRDGLLAGRKVLFSA